MDKTKNFVESLNEKSYRTNQKKIWNEMWEDFGKNIREDLEINPNADVWFQYVVSLIKKIKVENLKLLPLIEIFEETEIPAKKYNILLCNIKKSDIITSQEI